MNLQRVQEVVMHQAAEKSWGTCPDDIIVAEKLLLIHSELSEAYAGFLIGNIEGRDGFYEELGDCLTRTLHLGGIFEVSFLSQTNDPNRLHNLALCATDAKIATLHRITSDCWEHYRKNRMLEFKEHLILLAQCLAQTSDDIGFSIENAILRKLEINKDRVLKK